MTTSTNMPRKKNKKKMLIYLLVFATGPALINLIFGHLEQFSSLQTFIDYSLYGYIIGLVFWLSNWFVGTTVGKRLNWRENPARANLISMLSFIGLGIIVSLLVPYFYLQYIQPVPAERLWSNVVGRAFIAITVDLIVISIYYSGFIVRYWGESIKNEEALKRENLIAQYEALKSQVNPHFLFNSLNTLTGIVEKYPDKASAYISKLATIYRYVLDQRNKDIIPLKEELHFLDDFIYLSKIRYGDGMTVTIQLNGSDAFIVPMALQMLLENAIKHNVISDEAPLHISLYQEDGFICMKNNLQAKSTMESTNKVGLENLTKRYQYLSNKQVEVDQRDGYFVVKIPLLKEDAK